MMRTFPKTRDDRENAKRLEAPVWMIEQLKMNPAYVFWGPHEEYMYTREGSSGWNTAVIVNSWEERSFELDELNEVVNFYFEINKPRKSCETCGGNGHHPDAQWITESWYRHTSPFTKPDSKEERAKAILSRFGVESRLGILGRGALPPEEIINKYGKAFLEHCVQTIENGGELSTNITQDEVDALWEGSRFRGVFKEKPTAQAVNSWAREGGFRHDAINAWICTKRRCERLGVPYTCPTCEGHGYLFTGPAYLSLVLWVLHPRKGCSRGVEVNHIQQKELPAVYQYLRQAAERNQNRFSKIPKSSKAMKRKVV